MGRITFSLSWCCASLRSVSCGTQIAADCTIARGSPVGWHPGERKSQLQNGKSPGAALSQCLGQRMCPARTQRSPLRWPCLSPEGTLLPVQFWIHHTRPCLTFGHGLLRRGCSDHWGQWWVIGGVGPAFVGAGWLSALWLGFLVHIDRTMWCQCTGGGGKDYPIYYGK